MKGVTFHHPFLVCKLPTSADGIIWLNFLTPQQARLDLGNLSLVVSQNQNQDLVASLRHEALTEDRKRRQGRGLITHISTSQKPSLDVSGESGCANPTTRGELKKLREEIPNQCRETNLNPKEVVLSDAKVWTVVNRETVMLHPKSKHAVIGKVLGGNSRDPSCSWCVEPAHVPIEGICVARVLTKPGVEIHKSQSDGMSALSAGCTELNANAAEVTHGFKVSKQPDGGAGTRHPHDTIVLIVANFSEEILTLPKGTVLGIAQEVSEILVVSVTDQENADEGTERTFFSGNNKELQKVLRST
jgi:hypothetical protein